MNYGYRRPVLLKVKEPSLGVVQLGKIARVKQAGRVLEWWRYVNNISAEMRKINSFGVAPCVVRLMAEWNVPVIHYYDKDTDMTYTMRMDEFLENAGNPRRASESRSPYYYLPRPTWHAVHGQLHYEFVPDGTFITLTWDVPEIAAWTMAQNASQLAML
jgi:hypothetical protein